MNSQELLEKLKLITPEGVEVCNAMGLLSSSKAIYYRKKLVFVFRMEYNFSFKKENGLTEEEFLENYKKWNWRAEQVIG